MDITRTCLSCAGTGTRTVSWTEQGEGVNDTCTICNGTGVVDVYSIDLSDITNKLDDIKEVVDEIKAIVEA